MDKKISCGVIIRDPVTRLICAGLPTGKYGAHMSIPKGEQDPGEVPIETAVRELFEETGLAIPREELRDLGLYPYLKGGEKYPGKDLHLFYTEREVNLRELHCDSYFLNKTTGKMLPEICGFAMISLDDHKFLPAMESTLRQALTDHDLLE
jgi:8-oxo-dGTP pyrophosphatase MutT (NUDIX family)